MSASDYGRFYWCVEMSTGAKVFVHADVVRLDDGVLSLLRDRGAEHATEVNFAAAPGSWRSIYAASQLDGHAVAVEHWDAPKARKR